MSRFLYLAALLGALSAVDTSCQRDPAVAATPADRAVCERLQALGCTISRDPSCPAALARLRQLGPDPSPCVLRARSSGDVSQCGVGCP